MYPSVQALALHLPNEQTVFMDDKEYKDKTGEDRRIAYKKVLERNKKTSLTEFFQLNIDDEEARKILYPNI